ncbi:MAG TPA: hypothetical protein VMU92_02810 [Acidobacteriaceae bacterium]|nr:hypothetical protein [Acidobacteriaceae bacterium]
MKQTATTRKIEDTHLSVASAEEREEQHHRMTLEAITDIDAGRLIDHAYVQTWAASLYPDS